MSDFGAASPHAIISAPRVKVIAAAPMQPSDSDNESTLNGTTLG